MEPEKARIYQSALCDLAARENCIICLPTGCGKTYIALSVAKSEFLAKAISQNKKIVFLANSVPLVYQQAAYFKRHISSSSYGEKSYVEKEHVKAITGAMGTDNWDKENWKDVMDSTDVMVMIPEVLRIALNHKYVTLDQINLLIFDECHHATKSHPMAIIMEDYKGKKENYPSYQLPRVIGLTATIIMGTCKENKIAEDVEDMQRTLLSRAVTYPEYDEVLRFSTSAHISIVPFKTSARGTENLKNTEQTILTLLEETIASIDAKAQAIADSRHSALRKVNHPDLKSTNQMFNKNKISAEAADIKKALTDVKKVFENEGENLGLGLYSGRLGALQKLAFLALPAFCDGRVAALKSEAEETLREVVAYCESIVVNIEKPRQIETYVSAKIDTLYKMLLTWNFTVGKKEPLCGIIFCEERFTAQILAWHFVDASTHCQKYGFIKPAFVIGGGGAFNDLEEQQINALKLEETIQNFREGKLNLLFATNVLEEGLDVPDCNFVIRFDRIPTYPSFVQSMGRARAKGALYSVMTPAMNFEKTVKKVEKFQSYSKALAEYLINSEERLLNVNEREKDSSSDKGTQFLVDPEDPDSPKITLTSSVQLINSYCQLLPLDLNVKLEATSWWNEVGHLDGKVMYKAWVVLPKTAAVTEAIEGKVTDSKNEAKRHAFLEACRRLYLAGALDENLFPKQGETFQATMDNQQDTQKFTKIDSTNIVQWYEKKVAKSISEAKIEPGQDLKSFLIEIVLLKSTTDSPERENLYCFDNYSHKFVILTNVNLEDIPSICLYGRYGVFKCSFVAIELKESKIITRDQFVKIENFQKFLFSQCLNITHPLMSMSNSHPFLIAAVIHDKSKNNWAINWRMMDKSVNIDATIYSTHKSDDERRKSCYSTEELENAVVIPWYHPEEIKFYCVCSIRKDLTPSSPMKGTPKSNCKSFDEHYSKYHLKIVNRNQPFVRCAAVSSQLNFLTVKRKDDVLTKVDKKMNHDADGIVDLIPEFLSIFPMPASLFIQARFLPSIIHRIHRLILSREIQLSVAKTFEWRAAMNWKDDGSSFLEYYDRELPSTPMGIKFNPQEITTSTANSVHLNLAKNSSSEKQKLKETCEESSNIVHLDYIHPEKITPKEIQKHGLRKIQKNYSKSKFDLRKDFKKRSKYIKPLLPTSQITFKSLDASTDYGSNPGPSSMNIMEALTLANANDVLSLENLEVIGDSFLKYCVSTHIFCEFPSWDEGNMTELRNKLVSNSYLFKIGSKKQIGEYLAGGIFLPHHAWLPPGQKLPAIAGSAAVECDTNFDGFSLSKEEIERMTHDQLVSWIKMNKATVNMSEGHIEKTRAPANCTFTHTRLGNKSVSDCVEALIGVYYMNGGLDAALALMDWMGLHPSDKDGNPDKYRRRLPPKRENILTRGNKTPEDYIPLLSELENLIDYKFKDKWLIVEAFSYPGFFKNTVAGSGGSYERLEFIGDAVLDFLVTNHIYKNGLRKTPGELTDLRSALVNNVTFGSLSVRFKLHNYLRFFCQKLQRAINKFEAFQNENGQAVVGHFSLMTDWESPVGKVAMENEVPKVLGDIFESLAGAVFLDSNMSLDRTWTVFYRLMKNEIDEFTKHTPLAPVRELYEKCPDLRFQDVKEADKSEKKGMTHVEVKLNGKRYIGKGTNRKQAKQAAAKYALLDIKSSETG